MRRCVYENINKDEIQKLFPDEVLPELQRLLTLLLQKFQREWQEDVFKDQVRSSVVPICEHISPLGWQLGPDPPFLSYYDSFSGYHAPFKGDDMEYGQSGYRNVRPCGCY